MGEVMVILKVFPEEPGKEDEIIEKLKTLKSGKVSEVKREALAFGVFVLIVGIVLANKGEGEMTALEEEVKAIEGVNQVAVEGITLL